MNYLDGLFMIESTITLTESNKSVVGVGFSKTKLMLSDGTNDNLIYGNGLSGITIKDLCLIGNKDNQSQVVKGCIQLINCSNITIENLIIKDAIEFGIDLQGCSNVTIHKVTTQNCGAAGNLGIGIYIRETCTGISITNCADNGSGLTDGSEGSGIQNTPTDTEITISNYCSWNAKKYGIKLQGTATINKVVVESSGGVGISIQSNDVNINNTNINNCSFGIDIIRFEINSITRNIVVENITIKNATYDGIYIVNRIDAEEQMTGISIEDFDISACQYGIRLRGNVLAIAISNGDIYDCTSRCFWSAGDVIGVPTDNVLSNVDVFGSLIVPPEGFTILEGTGQLTNCSVNSCTTAYNGDTYESITT